jgi:hypothetical protein
MDKAKRREQLQRDIDDVMGDVSALLERSSNARDGTITLRFIDEDTSSVSLHLSAGKARLEKDPVGDSPHVEIIGDARRLVAILGRKKEGRAQFFAGGLRVRGDLRYLSALAYELGMISEPF